MFLRERKGNNGREAERNKEQGEERRLGANDKNRKKERKKERKREREREQLAGR